MVAHTCMRLQYHGCLQRQCLWPTRDGGEDMKATPWYQNKDRQPTPPVTQQICSISIAYTLEILKSATMHLTFEPHGKINLIGHGEIPVDLYYYYPLYPRTLSWILNHRSQNKWTMVNEEGKCLSISYRDAIWTLYQNIQLPLVIDV